MIIYKTTNLINNKFYIGKSVRNSPHYLGSGKYLKSAIKKYGIENFKKDILEYCSSKEELNVAEKYWIEKLDARINGYNIAEGGHGGFSGVVNSGKEYYLEKFSKKEKEEWLKLNRKGTNNGMFKKGHLVSGSKNGMFNVRLLGEKNGMFKKTHTEEATKRISEGNKKKRYSKEARKQMSLNRLGKKNPMYGKRLVGKDNSMYGYKFTKEQRKEIIKTAITNVIKKLDSKNLEFNESNFNQEKPRSCPKFDKINYYLKNA